MSKLSSDVIKKLKERYKPKNIEIKHIAYSPTLVTESAETLFDPTMDPNDFVIDDKVNNFMYKASIYGVITAYAIFKGKLYDI
jgi:hypothetical protein